MVTEHAAWPRPDGAGVIDELPCAFARNVTYHRGYPQGRRGMRILYRESGGPAPSTAAVGAIRGLWRYRSRGGRGIEYIIVAGYSPGADTGKLTVSVFAGRNRIATADFVPAADATYGSLSEAPLTGVGFADSFFITGPMLTGLASATPFINFIRVRFQRSGVSIAETELFDRKLVPFSPGDDPAPYLGRTPKGIALAVFQSRLVLAYGNNVYWSNVGDPFGWSATSYLTFPGEGDITALAPGDRYLLVLKERSGAVMTGKMTSASDTSISVIDQRGVGALSHRGVLQVPGGHVALNHEGVFFISPSSESIELTAGIRNWLHGDTGFTWGTDSSRWMPVRESFNDAPGAYLPGRREVIYALSSGAWAPGGENSLTQRPNGRDLWLVIHLGVDGKARVSVWFNNTSTQRIAESMVGYVDQSGRDTLLHGSYNGRVFIDNVCDTDETAVGTFTEIESELQLAPVPLPSPGRVVVRNVEMPFVEERNSTAGAVTLRFVPGLADGSYVGGDSTVSFVGSNIMPVYGTAYPFKARTLPITRRKPGVPGVCVQDALHMKIRGPAAGGPLPALPGPLVLHVHQHTALRA